MLQITVWQKAAQIVHDENPGVRSVGVDPEFFSSLVWSPPVSLPQISAAHCDPALTTVLDLPAFFIRQENFDVANRTSDRYSPFRQHGVFFDHPCGDKARFC